MNNNDTTLSALPPQLRVVALTLLIAWAATQSAAAAETTTLSIDGARFTLKGKPTFLLGISYYGALGAPEKLIQLDLDDIKRHGFNWLRVWATWESFGDDLSAVHSLGQPRQPYIDKLKWLVAECDRRGLIVDVTLTRGKGIGRVPDFESHERAVETVVNALKQHRNWFLDLANERDVRDDRFVPPDELKKLRDLVRRLDPPRIVTASFGGHDLDASDIRDALVTAELDFLAPHRPRGPESPAQTEARTRECLALLKQAGRTVPILHQEPFRRGYTTWQPSSADFLTDLRGAVAGGAAGWCFHNGSQRGSDDHHPRRSFDLRAKRLFDQLDAEEHKVIAAAQQSVQQASTP
jgi:hypothetical protein